MVQTDYRYFPLMSESDLGRQPDVDAPNRTVRVGGCGHETFILDILSTRNFTIEEAIVYRERIRPVEICFVNSTVYFSAVKDLVSFSDVGSIVVFITRKMDLPTDPSCSWTE